ncbi:MAG: enoyl-CoA hydratase/isomerase family protein [Gemmatimonadota bacterium]|jgi:methylglutaconyl-CoA hydratase|nr:enoyl-CoA hydratase/isomerase family protein [Gemmatimonadota bacterium]
MSVSSSSAGGQGAGEDRTQDALAETMEGPVRRLILNRPEKRNALDRELVDALARAFRRAGDDASVRVVTLEGRGKDFCAGADLSALARLTTAPMVENLRDAEALAELFLVIRTLEKPVVARVRGRALAGGCGLAAACDLVLAEESAIFGYPEVQLGFVPAIVLGILRRNVSEKRAFEMISTGKQYPASEMKRFGLVNETFPDAGFDDHADGFVRELAGRSASALSLAKRLLYSQDTTSFSGGISAGVTVNTLARLTADTREGMAAFVRSRTGGSES